MSVYCRPAKRALVAGASSGIGAATARALAAEGFNLHLLARREEQLQRLAQEMNGTYTAVDMRSALDAEHALAELEGPIGVAVYAAGTLTESPIDGHPVDLWNQAIAVNLTGAFLFARGVIEHLAPGSRLIFISSVAASKGQPSLGAYAASKAGLARFVESLSSELEPRGVGVHVIAPGPVATPMLDVPGTSPFQLDPEQVADVIAYLARLPADVVLRQLEIRAVIKGPFARRRHDGNAYGSNEPGSA